MARRRRATACDRNIVDMIGRLPPGRYSLSIRDMNNPLFGTHIAVLKHEGLPLPFPIGSHEITIAPEPAPDRAAKTMMHGLLNGDRKVETAVRELLYGR